MTIPKLKHVLKLFVAKTFNLYMEPKVVTRYMTDHSVLKKYLRFILEENSCYVEIGAGISGSADQFHKELGVSKDRCYLIEACP